MRAEEFGNWVHSLPEGDYVKALARLTELRIQNNQGLTGELYRSMMEQTRDQVRREYESNILVPEVAEEEPARHKVRLEVKKGVFLTFDTADIEDIHVSSHRGYDSAPDDTGKFMVRKLNGQNTLDLTIEFKHGKHETWEQG